MGAGLGLALTALLVVAGIAYFAFREFSLTGIRMWVQLQSVLLWCVAAIVGAFASRRARYAPLATAGVAGGSLGIWVVVDRAFGIWFAGRGLSLTAAAWLTMRIALGSAGMVGAGVIGALLLRMVSRSFARRRESARTSAPVSVVEIPRRK